jgi:hypothetical protein
MKTMRASLLLPLLTIAFSFSFSGCYTQLAIVDNEDYSSIEPTQIIITQPIITVPAPPVWPIFRPTIDPPYHPVYDPGPPAGSSSGVTEAPSQRRESGYQHLDRSDEQPTGSSNSDRRPSDSKRGGR